MKLSKIRFTDVINPLKWISFVRGYFNSLFLKDHLIEQYCIRLIECSDCVLAGQCGHCGCAMPEKAFDPSARCSNNNWGPIIMDRDLWIAHKEKYGITLSVNYNPQPSLQEFDNSNEAFLDEYPFSENQN